MQMYLFTGTEVLLLYSDTPMPKFNEYSLKF